MNNNQTNQEEKQNPLGSFLSLQQTLLRHSNSLIVNRNAASDKVKVTQSSTTKTVSYTKEGRLYRLLSVNRRNEGRMGW